MLKAKKLIFSYYLKNDKKYLLSNYLKNNPKVYTVFIFKTCQGNILLWVMCINMYVFDRHQWYIANKTASIMSITVPVQHQYQW